ncbi:hypothetical protein CWI38_1715p0020 [Hamiltosporidium tvaerminnensis]|uniref:EF-hand domain-containing protein n=2 Tax=Hamiltosporidium TaxID=1176354 RepID=A0A4Q9LN89_9MICR|nr:Calcium-binding protein NCS-1 [Hamiltosporidium tvaerminnensis]TBU01273.1 hypothetical protein CWI39_1433p0020 [Hamiltosporidium magnivora]TBU01840.1 hypothetical protein CWI37_0616p0030 [Hamiltosporidium tvaerminnensis]TBU08730.1 hypothetical protein CWI36_0103p0060 [Hamiltosporidium magnivora]TBU10501.1 hypothetical protein CWI38_1715p0020 [Hamiltosporidium tvaerminnensis]
MGTVHSTGENFDEESIRKFSHFDSEDVRRWSISFQKAFPTGYLSQSDLEKLFLTFFPFGSPKKFTAILFTTINISGTEMIDFHELLISFSILTKGSSFEKLRWMFRFYDRDNDGVVSKEEMRIVAQAVYDMVGSTFDLNLDIKEMIDLIFLELENESGFLTFDDFKSLSEKKSKLFKMLTIFGD